MINSRAPCSLLGPGYAAITPVEALLGLNRAKPRRFTPAIALNENKASNRRVNLHRKHPRPPSRINVREVSLNLAGFYAATRPQYAPLTGRLLRRRVHRS
jgi:hypothetical protein